MAQKKSSTKTKTSSSPQKKKTTSQKQEEKKMFLDGVRVNKKRDIKDIEGNDVIKVGLADGTTKMVPESLFNRKVSYK